MMYRFDERVIFDTSLPYDKNGYRSHNNRYSPYVRQVSVAERIFWATHSFPELDALINTLLVADGVQYDTAQIGDYVVYYNFSRWVAPVDYGLDSALPIDDLEQALNEQGQS